MVIQQNMKCMLILLLTKITYCYTKNTPESRKVSTCQVDTHESSQLYKKKNQVPFACAGASS
jgi:hypothetical protein